MITIGAFEAKTHLSALLDRAAAGEEIVITKHGRPVARLIGAGRIDSDRAAAAFDKLRELRDDGASLNGRSWKGLRDEGRK